MAGVEIIGTRGEDPANSLLNPNEYFYELGISCLKEGSY
jgi:hypothetical protein